MHLFKYMKIFVLSAAAAVTEGLALFIQAIAKNTMVLENTKNLTLFILKGKHL